LFYSSVPAEAITIAILKYASLHIPQFTLPLNLLNSVSVGTVSSVNSYNKYSKCSFSAFDTGPRSFCHSFIALSIIRCLTSAQMFAVLQGGPN